MSSLASLATTVKDLTEQVAALSARLDGAPQKKARKVRKEKDPNAVKKAPNAWILFVARIRSLLDGDEALKLKPTHANQFASSLKKVKEMSAWTDSEVLAERRKWVVPVKAEAPEVPVPPVPSSSPVSEPAEKKAKKELTPEEQAAKDAKKAAKKAAKSS